MTSTAPIAVSGVVPSTRRPAMLAVPSAAAVVSRNVEDVGCGAGRASIRASPHATAAVSAKTAASQSGRVSHQERLLGSGSVIPVTSAKTAHAPAIASSTGMCQR